MSDPELRIAEKLASENFLSQEQLSVISSQSINKPFSLHWELRTLLYLGISLFTAGIGILVYKNIDSIGHGAVIAFIAMLCAACWIYCLKKGLPFTRQEVIHPSPFFDYVLLLGCLLFVTLETYLQYQYSIFGERYNLATLAPVLPFFYFAYRFDHKGILSMALTAIAGSIGLTVTPLNLINGNNFSSLPLIMTAIVFALLCAGLGRYLFHINVKKHFTFTYYNFAVHIAFVSALAGLFTEHLLFVFLPLLCFFAFAGYRYARLEKSLYFFLITVIYVYFTLTYLIFNFLITSHNSGDGIFYIVMIYFVVSCFLFIKIFRNYRKLLNMNE
jgi:hypothetical protein